MAKDTRNYDEARSFNAPHKARFGGFARASKYEPVILSEWAAMGGNAVLEKYGREYFVELRKRRKNYSKPTKPAVFQPNLRLMKKMRQRAAQENGRKGGIDVRSCFCQNVARPWHVRAELRLGIVTGARFFARSESSANRTRLGT